MTQTKTLSLLEAVNDGLSQIMAEDPTVVG